jgi:hypothetical protein
MQQITEITKQISNAPPGSRLMLFATPYEQSEATLKSLLTLGFSDKLSQSFLKYYKAEHLTNTEDSILFILEMMFKSDYPTGRISNMCNIITIVCDEIHGESQHTKTDKFIEIVIPAFEVAGAAMLEMELKDCKDSANQTSAMQVAHFNFNRLNNACKRIYPNSDIHSYLARSISERINDLHIGEFEFPPADPLCLSPRANTSTTSTPPPSPRIRNGLARELRGLSYFLEKITDASIFEDQFDIIMDAIITYVKGEISISAICEKITEFRKDDRAFIDTWNIYDVMGHLDSGAHGFALGDLLLTKFYERDCRNGKGFLEKLAEPIKSWLSRSLFYTMNRVAHNDQEYIKYNNSFSEYVDKYREVWGCDLPFTELGEQIETIANRLYLRRKTIMLFKNKEHLKDKMKINKNHQYYLDYVTAYKYNFESPDNKFPKDFGEVSTSLIIKTNSKSDAKTFYSKMQNDTINNLSFTIRSTETIRQIKTMFKFAESLQELMYDGELLIPKDPSFWSLEV